MLRDVFFSLLVLLSIGLIYEFGTRHSVAASVVFVIACVVALLVIAFGMNVGCLFTLCADAGGDMPDDPKTVSSYSHSQSILWHTMTAAFNVTGNKLRISTLTCDGALCPSPDMKQYWELDGLEGTISSEKTANGFLVTGPLVDALKRNAISHAAGKGFNALYLSFMQNGEKLRVTLDTDICLGFCISKEIRADLHKEKHVHADEHAPGAVCRAMHSVDSLTRNIIPRSIFNFFASYAC